MNVLRKAASAMVFLAAFLFPLAGSIAAPQQSIWASDPKIVASLQPSLVFGTHTIRLPQGYIADGTSQFEHADKWQWHGAARADGTRPVIEVWVVTLTPQEAAGDVIGYGESLLTTAGKDGVSGYTRGLDETGIDEASGNWVTRYASECVIKSPAGYDVALASENYVWLDHGELMLATYYDAANHAPSTRKEAEASIWSVQAQ